MPIPTWITEVLDAPIVHAPLPIPFVATYVAFDSDPFIVAQDDLDVVSLSKGDVLIAVQQGVTSDVKYGLRVSITILQAYFAVLLDTIKIGAVFEPDIYTRISCPTPEVYTKEDCPDPITFAGDS